MRRGKLRSRCWYEHFGCGESSRPALLTLASSSRARTGPLWDGDREQVRFVQAVDRSSSCSRHTLTASSSLHQAQISSSGGKGTHCTAPDAISAWLGVAHNVTTAEPQSSSLYSLNAHADHHVPKMMRAVKLAGLALPLGAAALISSPPVYPTRALSARIHFRGYLELTPCHSPGPGRGRMGGSIRACACIRGTHDAGGKGQCDARLHGQEQYVRRQYRICTAAGLERPLSDGRGERCARYRHGQRLAFGSARGCGLGQESHLREGSLDGEGIQGQRG